MTATKAVEKSVTFTNSLSQDYTNLDDQISVVSRFKIIWNLRLGIGIRIRVRIRVTSSPSSNPNLNPNKPLEIFPLPPGCPLVNYTF